VLGLSFGWTWRGGKLACWGKKFCLGPVVLSFEIWIGWLVVGSARRPHYNWASKVLMYFAVCLFAIQWITQGCYFYLLLMLDYYFLGFDIVCLFKINVNLNLFFCLYWPIFVPCIIIKNGCCYIQNDRKW
jgi:hypothetical protein